jgi:hypothetical protein
MKVFILLIFILFPVACAIKDVRDYGRPPDFDKYANEFMELTSSNWPLFKSFHVSMVNIPKHPEKTEQTIGLFQPGRYPKIEIDRENWMFANEHQRWALVFHELGHSLCHLPHIEDFSWNVMGYDLAPLQREFDDGCPISLMTIIQAPSYCLTIHQTDYEKRMVFDCKYRQGFF